MTQPGTITCPSCRAENAPSVGSTIVADTMKKGDMVRWAAPAPGQYRVTCDYPPQMSATITVSP